MGSLSGKCMCDGMTEWALCLVNVCVMGRPSGLFVW